MVLCPALEKISRNAKVDPKDGVLIFSEGFGQPSLKNQWLRALQVKLYTPSKYRGISI